MANSKILNEEPVERKVSEAMKRKCWQIPLIAPQAPANIILF